MVGRPCDPVRSLIPRSILISSFPSLCVCCSKAVKLKSTAAGSRGHRRGGEKPLVVLQQQEKLTEREQWLESRLSNTSSQSSGFRESENTHLGISSGENQSSRSWYQYSHIFLLNPENVVRL